MKHKISDLFLFHFAVDMQSLMSNLLASAAGKQTLCPPGNSAHFHADSFILPGEYRSEVSAIAGDEGESSDGDIHLYDASEKDTSSYVPCYEVTGYSSQPTYIRGDFYNLSPPSSPVLKRSDESPDVERTKQKEASSFTIDSIIGSSTEATQNRRDTSARVYSAMTTRATPCSFGQFRFSMTDWSVFQNLPGSNAEKETPKRKLFWCHACETFLESEENVHGHQASHRNKGDNCRLQRKFFSAHGYVTVHEETDYLTRIKCGLCEKVVTNCFFKKHARRHDGHVCELCGHESSSNSLLLAHRATHAGLTPYSCRTCGRKFGERSQMVKHELMHRKTANKCSFCGKSFCSRYSRVVHERTHTGYKPFECRVPGCNRSFPQEVQLLNHAHAHL